MAGESGTVLIASVGTTAEPITKVVSETREQGALTLFLVYGRAIGEQEPTPFSVTNTISQEAKKLGVVVKTFEMGEPESLDHALRVYREVLAEAVALHPDKIVLDITGGTKVMAGALTYVALSAPWDAALSFRYTGGTRNEYGRVKDMVVRIDELTAVRELAVKVLERAREHDYARALYLAENLPKRAKFDFIRKAMLALWYWDTFHYKESTSLLTECAQQARVLVDDALCSRLADTVVRLKGVTGITELALEKLDKLQKGEQPPLTKEAGNGWLYLLGDTIANARRRVKSNPTDSVLRCYRALEIATQIALVRLGINPWQPDWARLSEGQQSTYLAVLGVPELPSQLSLHNGLKLLEALSSPLTPQTNQDIGDITTTRNYSYLEHGYQRVLLGTAEKLLSKAERIVAEIILKAGIDKNPLECAQELRLET